MADVKNVANTASKDQYGVKAGFIDMPSVAKDFLIYLRTIKRHSENTIYSYYLDLKLFLKYIKKSSNHLKDDLSSIDISDITPAFINEITVTDLYDYLYYISKAHGKELSAATLSRKIATLKSFFKYLQVKARIIENNPAKDIDTPKLKSAMPKYLNLDESVSLLQTVNEDDSLRDYAMVTLFLNCGLRLSELVGINLTDIKDDTILIRGKGNKERTIYLNSACLDALKNYIEKERIVTSKNENALFLSTRKTRISRRMVQVLVKKYLLKTNLDTHKYSTHKLRHTAATLMYKHGNVDIRSLQEILGHKHLSTTEIYTHTDSEILRDAMNKNPLTNIELTKKKD